MARDICSWHMMESSNLDCPSSNHSPPSSISNPQSSILNPPTSHRINPISILHCQLFFHHPQSIVRDIWQKASSISGISENMSASAGPVARLKAYSRSGHAMSLKSSCGAWMVGPSPIRTNSKRKMISYILWLLWAVLRITNECLDWMIIY